MMNDNVKKISKNYIFNLSYQLLLIIIPIITTPYLARVLLTDGIGLYSYLYSIVTYFILFSAFGFQYYSQRVMINYKDDLLKRSTFFWEIFFLKSILVAFSIIGLSVFFSLSTISKVFLFMSIEVIACMLDINFIYQANENYMLIALVNLVIKTLNVVAIFLFVKSSQDLWVYALIQSCTVLISNLAMWAFLKGFICFVPLRQLKIFKHFLPCLYLFVPTIAIAVYRTLDKTLIGIITGSNYENAIYEQAEKIIRVLLTIITALGSVMISRNSVLKKEKNFEQIRENIKSSLRFVFLLSLPMITGVIIISDFFVPFFLGSEYSGSIILMKIYSIVFLSVGVSNVLGLQYFVALGQDKYYIISIIIGAVTNFVLNIVFINLWGALGATISTVIAESIIAIMMSFFSKKFIPVLSILIKSWRYIVASLVMFIAGYLVESFLVNNIFLLLLNVLLCAIIYVIMLGILKDDFILKVVNIKKQKRNE